MADSAKTLSKTKVVPLLEQEISRTGFTHKFVIDYTDTNTGTGSTDTETVTLGTTPAKFVCTHALVRVATAFAGTTAFTVSVGFGSNTTAALAATTVLTAGILSTAGAVVASAANSTGTSAVAIKAVFTNATGGSPSALTAGQAVVYLRLLDVDRLP
jgi:hypothetical protein